MDRVGLGPSRSPSVAAKPTATCRDEDAERDVVSALVVRVGMGVGLLRPRGAGIPPGPIRYANPQHNRAAPCFCRHPCVRRLPWPLACGCGCQARKRRASEQRAGGIGKGSVYLLRPISPPGRGTLCTRNWTAMPRGAVAAPSPCWLTSAPAVVVRTPR